MEEVTTRTLCDQCKKEIASGSAVVRIEGGHVRGTYGASAWKGDYCSKECFLAAFNWLYDRG